MLSLPLVACGQTSSSPEPEAAETAAADYERGPHNGRMLRDGDFALEITVFEDGIPPEYRLYAYLAGKPLASHDVAASVTIQRLDGEITTFSFRPEQDYLRGSTILAEPHSFDVTASASHAGKQHRWRFASYEGRTTIAPEAARAGGLGLAVAGPVDIAETLDVNGRIELDPAARAEVGAKYPGPVVAVYRSVGDRVARGALLARVESSYSLQTYAIHAPIAGVVVERATNVGGVAGTDPLFVIADPARLVASFPLFSRDLERVRPGQPIQIKALDGDRSQSGTIRDFLPLADIATQSVTARVSLTTAGANALWRPGMAVRGVVTVDRRRVPLAVRTEAIQQYRDFRVVFAKVGNTYEVRMLELGKEGPEWTEVLGGLKPGTTYAAKNSYLIKADVEKSGASHDH
ncbi:MAG: efflux RND transporter periplasmic adaptor subunit [Beijerinckiaceae bacterium]|nr:efflux RND transporter periplasmic adaptor subunit [Beijerinckiaceae bacterium]